MITLECKIQAPLETVWEIWTNNPNEAQRGGWQAILNNFKKYAEKYKLSA